MARKKYRASELVAGRTIFVSSISFRASGDLPVVHEHLIGSERDPLAEPGRLHYYRLPPSFVQSVASSVPFFKTRGAALADANAMCKRFNSLRKVRDV